MLHLNQYSESKQPLNLTLDGEKYIFHFVYKKVEYEKNITNKNNNYNEDEAKYIIYRFDFERTNAYFIQLNPNFKNSKNFDFSNFKHELKNAIFFINFTCAEDAVIDLPLNVNIRCFSISQPRSVIFKGNKHIVFKSVQTYDELKPLKREASPSGKYESHKKPRKESLPIEKQTGTKRSSDQTHEHGSKRQKYNNTQQFEPIVDLAISYFTQKTITINQESFIQEFLHKSYGYSKTKSLGNSIQLLFVLSCKSINDIKKNTNNESFKIYFNNLFVLAEYYLDQILKKNNHELKPNEQRYITIIFSNIATLLLGNIMSLQLLTANFFQKFILTILNYDHELTNRNIATSITQLGRFAERKDLMYLLYNISAHDIKNLLNKLKDSKPTEQDIANFLTALGRFVEEDTTRYLVKNISANDIRTLVKKLKDCNPTEQSASNTLTALGRFAEHQSTQDLLKNITADDVKTLIQKLKVGNPIDQAITSSLTALGRFVEEDNTRDLVKNITADDIKILINKLKNSSPTGQEIANSLTALGRFVEHESTRYLVKNITADDTKTLIEKLKSSNPNAQHITNSLTALGRFAVQEYTQDLLKNITADDIKILIEKLKSSNPNAQHITNSLTALGRFAVQEYTQDLLKNITADDIKTLIDKLKDSNQGQEAANSLTALGRFTEQVSTRDLVKHITADDIKMLIDKLQDSNGKSQQITNSLTALGRFTQQDSTQNLVKNITAVDIETLINKLQDGNAKAQEITNSLTALSRFAEQDSTRYLVKNITASVIKTLINKLKATNPDNQDISNTLFALGRFAKHEKVKSLLNEIATDDIDQLIYLLINNNLITIQIMIGLRALKHFTSEQTTKHLVSIKAYGDFIRRISKSHTCIHLIIESMAQLAEITDKTVFDKYLPSSELDPYITDYLEYQVRAKANTNKTSYLLTTLQSILYLVEKKLIREPSVPLITGAVKKILRLHLSYRQLMNLAEILVRVKGIDIKSLLSDIEKSARFLSTNLRQDVYNALKITFPKQDVPVPQVPKEISNEKRGLAVSSIEKVKINCPDRIIPRYNIGIKEEMEQFCEKEIPKDEKGKPLFEYDFETNKSRAKDFYLAPVGVLTNAEGTQYAWGVFANKDLTVTNKTIGCYNGKRYTLENENANSVYLYELLDRDDNIVGVIDANELRDFTAYFNSSPIYNVSAKQMFRSGKANIYFYVNDTLVNPSDSKKIAIYKDQQVFITYGDAYYPNMGYKPFFLHPNDGPYTDTEIYTKQEKYYAPGTYRFDKQTSTELNLGHHDYVVPKIFFLIEKCGSEEEFRACLKDTPKDIFTYAVNVNTNRLLDSKDQQHLTPLMYACYIGWEKPIEILLENNNSDVGRFMLNEGLRPLTLLLMGSATNATIEKLGPPLLQKTYNPFIADKNDLTLLHYAIKRNSLTMVNELIVLAEKNNINIFKHMFDRDADAPSFADFDYCLLNNQFNILQILLNVAGKSTQMGADFIDYLKQGTIFREETLRSCNVNQLNQLNELLLSQNNIYNEVPTLKNMIKKLLIDKTSTHSGPTIFANQAIKPSLVEPQAVASEIRQNKK